MKIQGKTIEFDSDGWKVTELSDGRLKVEHNTSGETYHFSDAGELQASSMTAGSLNAEALENGVAGVGNSISRLDGELLAEQSPDGIKEVELVDVFESPYSAFRLDIPYLEPRSGSDNLQLRVSNDGGTSWQSGASDYSHSFSRAGDGGTKYNKGNIEDHGEFIGGQWNNRASFTVWIYTPRDTTRQTAFRAQGVYQSTGGSIQQFDSHIQYLTAEAISGIQLRSPDPRSWFENLTGDLRLVGVF